MCAQKKDKKNRGRLKLQRPGAAITRPAENPCRNTDIRTPWASKVYHSRCVIFTGLLGHPLYSLNDR